MSNRTMIADAQGLVVGTDADAGSLFAFGVGRRAAEELMTGGADLLVAHVLG